jgi:DHA2 family methylenomycin A resistance protein-like MFS transporter
MTTSLLGSVERSQAGVASGTLNAMRQTGSLLGIALFGSLIAGHGEFFPGMRSALIISLLVLAVGASLTWQLRQRGGDREEPANRALSASRHLRTES